MKLSTILLLTAIALTTCSFSAQTSGVPEIQYRSVPDFLHLPADLYFGEVTGVAVNSQGHIFVFSRGNTTGPAYGAAAAQLLEFGPDGKFLREIGHNLYAWSYAHSVKVDPQDNIWVTDKGSDVVVKFTLEGRVSMLFGRKQEASDDGTGPLKEVQPPRPPEDGLFRQVTDVAWDSAGNTYISDGYINSRIAKVDKDGNWLKSWGEPGDKPGQFDTPHSIAVDAQDNIYVADRGNHRIQVFDRNGKFLRQIIIDVPVPPDASPAIGNKTDHPSGSRTPGSPWAMESPHAIRAANDGKFARAGKVPSARQLCVHRLQRSRADMYEYLSFARSRVRKFLEVRRFSQRVQHGGMHQYPPFQGITSVHYAIDETELMVTNALRGGKAHLRSIDELRPDLRSRLTGDVLHLLISAIRRDPRRCAGSFSSPCCR